MNAVLNKTAKNSNIKSVVCAMSGGVDSSVAAMLLKREGYHVIGVSMQVWNYKNNGGCSSKKTCCSPDDFTDARKVAAAFDVPYYVFDFEETFRNEVIDRFISTYKSGKTPNPCVDCNSKVKFRALRDRASALSCDAVATGHYARIVKDPDGYHLLRSTFLDKDQSYFLYGLLPGELSATIFPVGEMSKQEVRELARASGIVTADKKESQDICFVSGELSDFLVRIGGKGTQGKIVNKAGKFLGEHQGLHSFTVGQRRGLGVGGKEEPLYVLELDVANNQVIVGKKSELERPDFYVNQFNWVNPNLYKRVQAAENFEIDAIVQIRSRDRGRTARVKVLSKDRVKIEYMQSGSAVSPGQAAVVYDLTNTEVLGGGRIE